MPGSISLDIAQDSQTLTPQNAGAGPMRGGNAMNRP